MTAFSKYANRQLRQIRQGGWPVVKRKLRSIASRIVSKVPVLRALYLVCVFMFFLTRTLFSPYSKTNLNSFSKRWSKFVEDQLRFQADERIHRLISIFPLINKNLPAASKAYCEFVLENPDYPEGYFRASNTHYLDGRYQEGIDKYYSKGMLLLEEQAKQSGLHSLATRFIGEEWSIIGHLGFLDFLTKLERLDLLSPEKRIVFMRKHKVANLCYLNYWSDHIDVYYLSDEQYFSLRNFAEPIFEHLSCLKLRQGFTSLYSAWNLAERSWQDRKQSPILKLKESDRERGLEVFEQLSIPSNAWFVALHVREGDQRVTRSNSNAKIETYVKAIKVITDRGGWVIRMGHPGMTPLPKMQRVVDYANSDFKSDWMDVFLWASCRFFIGTSSGPIVIPRTFGNPAILTNWPMIGLSPFFPNSIMLPKLFYSNTEKRYFSFQEMLDSSLGWTTSRVFEGIDCTIVDNSPEEIEAAVIEMLDAEYLAGQPNQMSELQTEFNNLCSKFSDCGGATISESFAHKCSPLFPQNTQT